MVAAAVAVPATMSATSKVDLLVVVVVAMVVEVVMVVAAECENRERGNEPSRPYCAQL